MEHCKPIRCKYIVQIFSCTLLISNSVISREIWGKNTHWWVFQRPQITRSSDSCYLEVFEKLTRAYFFQIALGNRAILLILKTHSITTAC